MKDKGFILIPILIWAAIIFGYGRCVYKMCTCNWEPVGKAEIVYTVGTFTGLGFVIGYLEIEDK
jgi:hypothetical protein